MNVQQERDFYEQQKEMPSSKPNIDQIGSYGLDQKSSSRSKTGEWPSKVIIDKPLKVLASSDTCIDID